MTYDQIKICAVSLSDKHPEKLIYCIDKPEFKSWFRGRIKNELALSTNEEFVFLEAVLLELIGK